jgi:hypothetical protein
MIQRWARSERNGGGLPGDRVFWLSATVLVTSFIFGGATRQGLVSEAIPELVSLPLVAFGLPRAMPFLKRFPSASALVIGLIVLPCIQLVPLPPALWSVLPGRSAIAEILTVAQVPMSWRPVSLVPVETSRALLSLLPAVAMFLATLTLEREARQRLLLVAVAMGVASALLAMLQVLGGSQIGLYFYDFTNVGRGVGFFANANHFGAFEYVLLPLGAGVGTFKSVYPLHERVTDLFWQRANRAHNDALETLFEGGALSLILLLAFVGWLIYSTYCAFVRQDAAKGRYARAGAIALWLLLVHSLWDYPLRTIALEALFGLCLALQFDPPHPRERLSGSSGYGAGATSTAHRRLKRHSSSSADIAVRAAVVPRLEAPVASAAPEAGVQLHNRQSPSVL